MSLVWDGLGFVNDLRAFLPAWQDMELASPSPDEPITQIEADVPVEPLALHADAADLDHKYLVLTRQAQSRQKQILTR